MQQFAGLAHGRNDEAFAKVCNTQAIQLLANIEANAWDGEWYKRAWFDDGTPLGSSENEECCIDSISHSRVVISGGGDQARANQVMAQVDKNLVRCDTQLIQLLNPVNHGSTSDEIDRYKVEP